MNWGSVEIVATPHINTEIIGYRLLDVSYRGGTGRKAWKRLCKERRRLARPIEKRDAYFDGQRLYMHPADIPLLKDAAVKEASIAVLDSAGLTIGGFSTSVKSLPPMRWSDPEKWRWRDQGWQDLSEVADRAFRSMVNHGLGVVHASAVIKTDSTA